MDLDWTSILSGRTSELFGPWDLLVSGLFTTDYGIIEESSTKVHTPWLFTLVGMRLSW